MTESSLLDDLRASLAPRYEVDCEVGRGGMATVYRAVDTQADSREVAIKVLMPELAAAVGADRFRREVAIASTLEHPRILNALDAGTTNDSLYLVMPFVRGESLRDRMRRDRQLPVAEAVTIAKEVAEALAYAHARGFVHRDVKPENILLEDGHAIVADFGIARVITQNVDSDTLTRTGVAVGTPLYMSPEQSAAEKTIDGRSDEYSLGCVLYEMLIGEPPFTGNSTQMLMARHAMEPVPSVRVVRETVPEHVEDAIYRALEKSPADRYPTVEAFGRALGDPTDWRFTNPTRGTRSRRAGRGARPWWRRRPGQRALMAGGVAAALAVAAGATIWRRHAAAPTSAAPVVTIAVAPFKPLRAELNLWQEGMVDLMSRNLEGAGPIRAVSPPVVLRASRGFVDRTAARSLGTRTGARYVVFGSLGTVAGGAVHMTAQLLDVQTDSQLTFERSGTEVSALADSLTLLVLGEVAKRFPVGAVRRTTPFSGVAITALKPFLEGEQAYRRTEWPEALAAYRRAIALDTAFALAYHRAGQVMSWQIEANDSLTRDFSLRAGALNHRLAPRDSLLLVADSVSAALYDPKRQIPDWPLVRRLFSTVNLAAAHFPADPEVWFALGEARYHNGYGALTNVSEPDVLDAFDRAIALDSGFAPAYIHAVELGFVLHGRERGRRYAERYLALRPTDADAAGIRIVERLTDPANRDSAGTARLLDTASTDALFRAEQLLCRWPDSAYTAISLVRTVARRPRDAPSHVQDSLIVQQYLPLTLAYRGRMREAYDALGNRRSRVFAEMALLGGLEPDTAIVVFGRWLASGVPQAQLALPWWAERGDSASIRALASRSDSVARTGPPEARPAARYAVATAAAYLALARRSSADSTRALDRLLALSDTLCLTCYVDRLVLARLLAARHRDQEALAVLRQRLYTTISPAEVWIALERGRVASRLRARADADAAYRHVVDAWAGGDAELQPAVAEARRMLTSPPPAVTVIRLPPLFRNSSRSASIGLPSPVGGTRRHPPRLPEPERT